jgi:hypothetical protein
LVAEMIYHFFLGYSQRRALYVRHQSRLGHSVSGNPSKSPIDSKLSNEVKGAGNFPLL